MLTLKLTIIISTIVMVSCGTCPSAEISFPCTCQDDTITCGGYQPFNIKSVFEKISASIRNKTFSELKLQNGGITELEDGAFADISFKKFTITDSPKLTKISSFALNASAFTAEEFRKTGRTNIGDQNVDNLFNALSSLVNINRIFLDFTHVTKIPDNAFKIINGKQDKLQNIHLNYFGATYGELETVGSRPFYYLDKLKYLSIANQPLSHISAHAFDFKNPSKIMLELHLEATKVSSSSFESGVFMDTKRQVTVTLLNNKITSLNEEVFKPVFQLNDNNMVTIVIMGGNRFVCDCRISWMVKDKKRIHERLMEAYCTNGTSLWDLNEADFKNC